MAKKKIGRPNEERRARQLLEKIARKKAAPNKSAEEPPKTAAQISKPPMPN